eukprot:TRINITY_DN6250_c0_g2_i2.p2 TRINITY_DN6250_c0_g2~~TRINITY_DN6250_c0_g2_i2.p2  ORF type:complete len:157 (+),score=24.44 TRINITY_DN6250_c0_g2_i2:1324-1794(+)
MGAITVDGLERVLNGSYSREFLQGKLNTKLIELVNKFESHIRPELSTCQITISDFIAATSTASLLQNVPGIEFTFSLIDTDQDGIVRSADLYLLSYLMNLAVKEGDVRGCMKEYGDKLSYERLLKLLTKDGINEQPKCSKDKVMREIGIEKLLSYI